MATDRMTSPKDREPTEAIGLVAMSADVGDPRTLKVHFREPVTQRHRQAIVDGLNRAMVTAPPPVDHGRGEKLEAALEANAIALNAFIECVGHKMADSEHYRWCRLPTFAEVQDAMIANNAARAALTNKDTASTKEK